MKNNWPLIALSVLILAMIWFWPRYDVAASGPWVYVIDQRTGHVEGFLGKAGAVRP